GTSTGQDQLTANRGRYGLPLGIVERVQQKGEVIAHPPILGGAVELEQTSLTAGRHKSYPASMFAAPNHKNIAHDYRPRPVGLP
ncbi:hypothetical protein, partial [Burkholderia cepacia]|uniref:hypothetical protein n=1 Tax=Burkholderia cepacia TaxID=292 RepID=UPI001C8A5190